MIVIVLAGGKSSRLLGSGEKPLVKVRGKKLIDRVAAAIAGSRASGLLVAVSYHTPRTEEHCRRAGYPVIRTPGKGYHEDVDFLLQLHPLFISVASDLPFLTREAVDEIERAIGGSSVTGAIPLSILPEGVQPAHVFRHSGNDLVAVGLNIVTRSECSRVLVLGDPLLGVNVNTPKDLLMAEAIRPMETGMEGQGAGP